MRLAGLYHSMWVEQASDAYLDYESDKGEGEDGNESEGEVVEGGEVVAKVAEVHAPASGDATTRR